ncbi:YidC/Oxa1 family membrane protein insertase [Pseudomonadota bacterium]
MDKKKILNFVIIFLLVYLIMSMFFKPGGDNTEIADDDIVITTIKREFSQNELVSVEISNTTDEEIEIKNECPKEPLDVFKYKKGEWEKIHYESEISCEESSDITVIPDGKAFISYKGWNHELFGELGRYKISFNAGDRLIETPEFEVKQSGWFGTLWTKAFYQPIYNILIFLISIVPYNDLGFGIILLTIIIRTILLLPSQKAMKSQRKMQEVQPKLAKIKEKYKDNQEMIAKETMEIWKTHKVNPFGSCLPLLIQFPFLIAIFYVIQSGLNPDDAYLLYGPLQSFSLSNISVNFLGILDLTKINAFVLPLVVGIMQFGQMKLAMSKKKGKDEKKVKNEMEKAGEIMIYIMPVMIAVFTASLPAGVGLYWGTSTAYGIAQQLIVNKQVDEEKSQVKVVKN